MKSFLNGVDDRQRGNVGTHEGPKWIDPTADENVESTPYERLVSGLHLFAEVGVSLRDEVQKSRAANVSLLRRLETRTPVSHRKANQGVAVSGTPLVIGLGKPDQGYMWEVQGVMIGGTEVNVAAAGTAGLYVSAFVPQFGATPGMNNCVDYAAQLPNPGFYGGRKIYVNAGEHLIVVVYGGTTGQTYVATVNATVLNVAAGSGLDVNAI